MKEDTITFAELLHQSVIFQGLLTLMVWGAVVFISIYQVVNALQNSIPDVLGVGAGAIIAYFFASKDRVQGEKELGTVARALMTPPPTPC